MTDNRNVALNTSLLHFDAQNASVTSVTEDMRDMIDNDHAMSNVADQQDNDGAPNDEQHNDEQDNDAAPNDEKNEDQEEDNDNQDHDNQDHDGAPNDDDEDNDNQDNDDEDEEEEDIDIEVNINNNNTKITQRRSASYQVSGRRSKQSILKTHSSSRKDGVKVTFVATSSKNKSSRGSNVKSKESVNREVSRSNSKNVNQKKKNRQKETENANKKRKRKNENDNSVALVISQPKMKTRNRKKDTANAKKTRKRQNENENDSQDEMEWDQDDSDNENEDENEQSPELSCIYSCFADAASILRSLTSVSTLLKFNCFDWGQPSVQPMNNRARLVAEKNCGTKYYESLKQLMNLFVRQKEKAAINAKLEIMDEKGYPRIRKSQRIAKQQNKQSKRKRKKHGKFEIDEEAEQDSDSSDEEVNENDNNSNDNNSNDNENSSDDENEVKETQGKIKIVKKLAGPPELVAWIKKPTLTPWQNNKFNGILHGSTIIAQSIAEHQGWTPDDYMIFKDLLSKNREVPKILLRHSFSNDICTIETLKEAIVGRLVEMSMHLFPGNFILDLLLESPLRNTVISYLSIDYPQLATSLGMVNNGDSTSETSGSGTDASVEDSDDNENDNENDNKNDNNRNKTQEQDSKESDISVQSNNILQNADSLSEHTHRMNPVQEESCTSNGPTQRILSQKQQDEVSHRLASEAHDYWTNKLDDKETLYDLIFQCQTINWIDNPVLCAFHMLKQGAMSTLMKEVQHKKGEKQFNDVWLCTRLFEMNDALNNVEFTTLLDAAITARVGFDAIAKRLTPVLFDELKRMDSASNDFVKRFDRKILDITKLIFNKDEAKKLLQKYKPEEGDPSRKDISKLVSKIVQFFDKIRANSVQIVVIGYFAPFLCFNNWESMQNRWDGRKGQASPIANINKTEKWDALGQSFSILMQHVLNMFSKSNKILTYMDNEDIKKYPETVRRIFEHAYNRATEEKTSTRSRGRPRGRGRGRGSVRQVKQTVMKPDWEGGSIFEFFAIWYLMNPWPEIAAIFYFHKKVHSKFNCINEEKGNIWGKQYFDKNNVKNVISSIRDVVSGDVSMFDILGLRSKVHPKLFIVFKDPIPKDKKLVSKNAIVCLHTSDLCESFDVLFKSNLFENDGKFTKLMRDLAKELFAKIEVTRPMEVTDEKIDTWSKEQLYSLYVQLQSLSARSINMYVELAGPLSKAGRKKANEIKREYDLYMDPRMLYIYIFCCVLWFIIFLFVQFSAQWLFFKIFCFIIFLFDCIWILLL